jgi:hypothetical protein
VRLVPQEQVHEIGGGLAIVSNQITHQRIENVLVDRNGSRLWHPLPW